MDAIERIRGILATEDISTPIALVAVETQAEAERQLFYGSPTIRVNGVDVAPPTDVQAKPTLACRVYQTDAGELAPIPSHESIRDALLAARSSILRSSIL